MKNKIHWGVLCAVLSFVTTFSKAQNTLLWEISGKDIKESCYLFGTYHVLNSDYLTEIPAVSDAFNNAAGVVVEVVIDSTELMRVMSTMTTMQEHTLSDLLNEEDYTLVAQEVQQTTGVPIEVYSMFKPSLLSMVLSLSYNSELNGEILSKYDGLPMDVYFSTVSKDKEIQSLETLVEQMDVLLNAKSLDEQAMELVELIKAKEEIFTILGQVNALYLDGNIEGMFALYSQYEALLGGGEQLLDERNENWIQQLPDILKKGNQFVAVGALHLPGDVGLIQLLKKEGYRVTPLTMK